MKHYALRKATALCLALLMLLIGFVSCTGGDTNTPADTTTAPNQQNPVPDSDETTEPAETKYPGPQITENLSGWTFRALSSEADDSFAYNELIYTDDSGDVINDAIFRRNAQITEKYGVIFEFVQDQKSKMKTMFTNAINAGNDDYHFASISLKDMMSIAATGNLAEVSELPYLDLDAPWYYQRIRESLSIGGREYTLAGYFNMRIFNTLYYVGYNKNLAEKYEIGDLTQLAIDGKWTLDKMYAYSSKVGADLNQDGKIDGEDQIGMHGHSGYVLSFFVGMDGSFVAKNSDDLPVYEGLSERNEQLLSKIVTMLYDEPACKTGDSKMIAYDPDPFMVDRQLFDATLLYAMPGYTTEGVNFGVLPYPKASEAQEGYRSMIHANHSSLGGIPVNNTEMDKTAAVVAELMNQSYQFIYPAHIEKIMMFRFAPDEQSTSILKLLFDSLCVEMSTALNMKCDTMLRTMANNHLSNFASAFAGIKKADETTIENYIKGFTGE